MERRMRAGGAVPRFSMPEEWGGSGVPAFPSPWPTDRPWLRAAKQVLTDGEGRWAASWCLLLVLGACVGDLVLLVMSLLGVTTVSMSLCCVVSAGLGVGGDRWISARLTTA